MFKKLLLTLLFVATAKTNCMADQSEEAESKSRKCKTFQNLKINPKVSLSTVDMKTLQGWQVNGTATIITKGPQYKKLLKVMIQQEVHHSTRRIIEDVDGIQKYDNYEVMFPEKVVMFKIKCENITKIGTTGKLQTQWTKKS